MNRVPWNKGLTKENDIRVANMAKTFSESINKPDVKAKMCASQKGHAVSVATRLKISKSNKGKPSSMLGKKHTKEALIKIREFSKHIWQDPMYRKLKSSITKEQWKDPVFRALMHSVRKRMWQDPNFVKRWMKKAQAKPNRAELFLLSVLQEIFPEDYKINIHADIMTLGGKVPDFVNVNGKKKLIELYGNYWHKGENPADRIAYFRQFGWETLVIWESELKNVNSLKRKILEFNKVVRVPVLEVLDDRA